MHDAMVTNCRFDRSRLPGAGGVKTFFSGCSFLDASREGAEIQRTVFDECEMRGVDLAGALTRGTRFSACDLRGARLDGLSLNTTHFDSCALAGVSGRPVLAGPFSVYDCDVPPARDGSQIVQTDYFFPRWGYYVASAE
jgi:uncharacterized protein YjbI with pentapeptide repeats